MEFKYNTTFANLQIKPVISEEKDKYLSVASLNALRKFLPEINTEKNIDLLPIAFDACVVNRVNKNGDVINGSTAYDIAKYFVNKPINIEHDRTRVVGCILNANFSKFSSNESLAELDVKSMKEPFNITLGGVIWKVVNQNLVNLIEESNDPTSENYMGVSASWELGFNEYNLVLLKDKEKNLENGKVITSEAEIEKLSSNLRAFGGSGRINENTYIYREVTGEVIPLGIGLTINPAADVEGVAINTENNEELTKIEENKSDIEISDNIEAENNISHLPENNVTDNKIIERIIMKIENINQITDELLKEVKASSITDFIQEELKKASEVFVNEKTEKEKLLKEVEAKNTSLLEESEKLKTEIANIKASLEKLEAEKIAKQKEEAFNIRMASFDEEFELSDEDRQVLATDIKDLEEEAFAAYKKKMAVLMKEKNKAAKKAKEEDMKKTIASKIEEAKASTDLEKSTTEVVDEVIDNSKLEKNSLPNSSTATEATVKEKYSKAFSFEEGFIIK
jgi:hypothetical protein